MCLRMEGRLWIRHSIHFVQSSNDVGEHWHVVVVDYRVGRRSALSLPERAGVEDYVPTGEPVHLLEVVKYDCFAGWEVATGVAD